MTEDAKECMKSAVLPVILGNGKEERRLAARLFKNLGVVSALCSKKSSFFDFFSISSIFLKLSESNNGEMLIHELLEISKKYSEHLLILVTSDKELSSLVFGRENELESSFIILSPERLFVSGPIADMSV